MSKRILIVDEDLMELNQLSLMLDSKGYEVCSLHQSYKIFTAISHCKPDLILMDSALSSMNSIVISRALKAIDTVKDIPLMMILGKDYNSYTYAFKPEDGLDRSAIKTTELDKLIADIDLKLAS